MEHWKIWIQIVTLIAGTGVLFDTAQTYRRYRYAFLKPLWWCYLFFNLGILTGVVFGYVLVNLFGDIRLVKASTIAEIIDPFGGLFFIGLAYSLFWLDRVLRDRSFSRGLRWLFAGGAVVIIVRLLVDVIAGHGSTLAKIMGVANMVVLLLAFVLSIAVLVRLALASRWLREKDQAVALRFLGRFYLTGCVLVLISAMTMRQYHGLVFASIGLLFNVFPFVWYRRHLPGFGNGLADRVAETDLSAVCAKYGVSSRQREIIELILRGKSNRDIADALFIAPHTVKNHIYSLYQKLGVKSRFELLNLMLEQAKR